MEQRPRGREKHITGTGKDIKRRGSGLGGGPVGSADGYQGREQASSGSSGKRASGGRRSPLMTILLIAALALGGGGAGLSGLLGGDSQPSAPQQTIIQQSAQQTVDLSSLLGGHMSNVNSGTTSTGWSQTANTGKLNNSVASGARAKRTVIKGGGRDTVTIMVYMCGTDLESRSGMATSDLQEMASATLSDKVNLLVYTGGCKAWKNSVVSSSVNQIYKVEGGGLRRLEADLGSVSMTKPATLTSFIKWCAKNYPANRNELILWDHGGGSISGYGYDEKYASSGSMNLKGIDQALNDAKVKFDFIGFDACLMATAENALMLSKYGDYMIASEETEPGIGWYYTNWLTNLSANTSLSTLEIGKNIADDFVDACAQKCRGQATTLSVVDLAELSATAPEELNAFAAATSKLLQNNDYQTVSNARSGSREFSPSNKLDQVDLIHLASNMGTSEGRSLANALLSAVKYNRTSSNMTNAYGLSIYFPYRKVSSVDNAVATYNAIGMDSEYARCIQQFASIETGGQAVSGGAASPLGALLGSSSSAGNTAVGNDLIAQMLGGLLTGSFNGVSGLSSGNSGFLGRSLNVESTAAYLADNRFDPAQLLWTADSSGSYQLRLSEQQWSLVHDLELNVFFDDGSGYIDLGLDNVFQFTQDGALLGDFDGTWLAINDQPVAYYHLSTVDDGEQYTITGRVPVLLNGQRSDLILVFDNEHPYGYIAGARSDYRSGETETVAKALTELQVGDEIDFLCDYYSYGGSYQDSYLLGDPMTVTEDMVISNVYIDADAAVATYRFTDLYLQQYWTPAIP